jgi:hypothetical protein
MEHVLNQVPGCRPNFSAVGRRRRLRIGWAMAAFTVAVFVAFALTQARWYWAALVFFPAAGAATTLLQVRRDTCVLRAQEGTIEHDDLTTTPASPEDARASRAVARTIRRDAALIALFAAAIAVAVSFV